MATDSRVPLRYIMNANPTWSRRDLGDLTGLMASLKEHGQLAPVLTDPLYLMLDGARRVEALWRLGVEEVWCVSTDRWETIATHLNDAAKRNLDPDSHGLRRSYVDIANLAPVLFSLRKSYASSLGAQTKKGLRAPAERNGPGRATAVTSTIAFLGVDEKILRVLSAAGTKLMHARRAGDLAMADRIEQAISDGERDGLRTAIVNAVAHAIDPSVPLRRRVSASREGVELTYRAMTTVPSRQLPVQARTVQRTLESIVSVLAALPEPSDLSIEHSTEEVNTWRRLMQNSLTTMNRFNKRLAFLQDLETETEDE